jgi:hypothetical protein
LQPETRKGLKDQIANTNEYVNCCLSEPEVLHVVAQVTFLGDFILNIQLKNIMYEIQNVYSGCTSENELLQKEKIKGIEEKIINGHITFSVFLKILLDFKVGKFIY